MIVIDYVREEVERQGHNIHTLDGIERVGWMLDAWAHALANADSEPTISGAIQLGMMIERHKNANGIRKCQVRVGSRTCPDFKDVPRLLEGLFSYNRKFPPPLEFYRQFEEIHPFEDGNGRTGKILLNWLNGSLLDSPIFPPDNFWGRPIRNP
jgi:hypothetical protein